MPDPTTTERTPRDFPDPRDFWRTVDGVTILLLTRELGTLRAGLERIASGGARAEDDEPVSARIARETLEAARKATQEAGPLRRPTPVAVLVALEQLRRALELEETAR